MGRTILTSTNLSSYVGKTIIIEGSECCWMVVGQTTESDSTVRDVKVAAAECYYYSGLNDSPPKIVHF